MLTTLGTGWLIAALGVSPQIDWIWTLLLAIVGILVIAYQGFNKFSVVVGPLFVCASILSVFRQMGQLSLNVEMPMLVVLTGILTGIAHLALFPTPSWLSLEKQTCSNP